MRLDYWPDAGIAGIGSDGGGMSGLAGGVMVSVVDAGAGSALGAGVIGAASAGGATGSDVTGVASAGAGAGSAAGAGVALSLIHI